MVRINTTRDGDILRLRHLAMKLSQLPVHPRNSVELEQYQTSGDLAAKWVSQIQGIQGAHVMDLGAGNGILGYAAHLLGAKKVTYVECDPQAAQLCRSLGEVIEGKVGEVELPEVDIVISNPPWGVQSKGADRIFIEQAAIHARNSIHIMHSSDATHLESMLPDWKAEINLKDEFEMPPTYSHHTSRKHSVQVSCWSFIRQRD